MEPVWLDLKRAAGYVSLSDATLRRYIGHATHPLPMHIVGGKWLIHRDELDAWVKTFPTAGEASDRLVRTLLEGLPPSSGCAGVARRRSEKS